MQKDSEIIYEPTREQKQEQEADDPVQIEEMIDSLEVRKFPLSQAASKLWNDIKAIDFELKRLERRKEINKLKFFRSRKGG